MDPETANQTDINTRFFSQISKGQTVSGKIKRQKTNLLHIFFKEKVNFGFDYVTFRSLARIQFRCFSNFNRIH